MERCVCIHNAGDSDCPKHGAQSGSATTPETAALTLALEAMEGAYQADEARRKAEAAQSQCEREALREKLAARWFADWGFPREALELVAWLHCEDSLVTFLGPVVIRFDDESDPTTVFRCAECREWTDARRLRRSNGFADVWRAHLEAVDSAVTGRKCRDCNPRPSTPSTPADRLLAALRDLIAEATEVPHG